MYHVTQAPNHQPQIFMRHRPFAAPNKSTTDLASFAEIQKFSNNRRHHQPPHHTHNVEAWKVSGNSPPQNFQGQEATKRRKKKENLTEDFFHSFPAAPTGPTTRSSTTPPLSPRSRSRPTKMARRRSSPTDSTTKARR